MNDPVPAGSRGYKFTDDPVFKQCMESSGKKDPRSDRDCGALSRSA